jgi:hypothetical protein
MIRSAVPLCLMLGILFLLEGCSSTSTVQDTYPGAAGSSGSEKPQSEPDDLALDASPENELITSQQVDQEHQQNTGIATDLDSSEIPPDPPAESNTFRGASDEASIADSDAPQRESSPAVPSITPPDENSTGSEAPSSMPNSDSPAVESQPSSGGAEQETNIENEEFIPPETPSQFIPPRPFADELETEKSSADHADEPVGDTGSNQSPLDAALPEPELSEKEIGSDESISPDEAAAELDLPATTSETVISERVGSGSINSNSVVSGDGVQMEGLQEGGGSAEMPDTRSSGPTVNIQRIINRGTTE